MMQFQDNVEKNIQTWPAVTKDVQTQAQYPQNEVTLNAPWIEVIKKQKGAMVDTVEVMKATLEEDAERKMHTLHVHIIGWTEKGSPQQNVENLQTKIRALDIAISSAWRVGKYEAKPRLQSYD